MQLVFRGQTHELAESVVANGWKSLVEVGPQVPYRQALAEMTAADVLLLLDTPGRRAGVAAKLYEYLGAGRPILALAEPDGDTAWVLSQSGATYRIAAPGDDSAIHGALQDLASMCHDHPQNGHVAGTCGMFTRYAAAGRLAELLDRVAVPAAVGNGAGEGELVPASSVESRS